MGFVYRAQRGVGRGACILLGTALLYSVALAQALIPAAAAPSSSTPATPQDSLGRSTPRGTVLGFLSAARQGDYEGAAEYVNTRQRGAAAAALAKELYVVLDHGLPPALAKLSDKPEGSQRYPAEPNQELVGSIRSAEGPVSIMLERLDHPKNGPIWLFSNDTVESVPALYEETESLEEHLPKVLKDTRFGGVALIEWIALFIGLPLAYYATIWLGKGLGAAASRVRRRLYRSSDLPAIQMLPGPLRFLAVAGMIKIWLANVRVPLIAREIWSGLAAVITIAACAWGAMVITEWCERRIVSHFGRRLLGGAPLVRFVRRALDLLLVVVAALVALNHFGVNTTAGLAGLGVGGIAVALAAQKTLENVIGGLSIIFDETIHIGDTLKLADAVGTVEAIGLRSTRIRTFDRTVLSVPNGQIANAALENLSARDKFRFLHTVGLEYGTSAAQLRSVRDQITTLLGDSADIDRASVRVRFIRFGASSLDVEVLAYIFAPGWNEFVGRQEALLLSVMEIVEAAGATIAFPSQRVYVSGSMERNGRDRPSRENGEEREAAASP